jgi:hypothetical protein
MSSAIFYELFLEFSHLFAHLILTNYKFYFIDILHPCQKNLKVVKWLEASKKFRDNATILI